MPTEQVYASTHNGPGPVFPVSASAAMEQEQRWRCRVCGQEMGYSQPIALGLAVVLMSAFIEHHGAKCGTGEEVACG